MGKPWAAPLGQSQGVRGPLGCVPWAGQSLPEGGVVLRVGDIGHLACTFRGVSPESGGPQLDGGQGPSLCEPSGCQGHG